MCTSYPLWSWDQAWCSFSWTASTFSSIFAWASARLAVRRPGAQPRGERPTALLRPGRESSGHRAVRRSAAPGVRAGARRRQVDVTPGADRLTPQAGVTPRLRGRCSCAGPDQPFAAPTTAPSRRRAASHAAAGRATSSARSAPRGSLGLGVADAHRGGCESALRIAATPAIELRTVRSPAQRSHPAVALTAVSTTAASSVRDPMRSTTCPSWRRFPPPALQAAIRRTSSRPTASTRRPAPVPTSSYDQGQPAPSSRGQAALTHALQAPRHVRHALIRHLRRAWEPWIDRDRV